jgi:hypothetical protein
MSKQCIPPGAASSANPVSELNPGSHPNQRVKDVKRGNVPVLKPSQISPLLLKTSEVCRLLGNVNARTVARLEERGLIRSVKMIRHKMYPYEEVVKLVSNLNSYKP